jgi:RimJ/RimL family protein N-acetyltransferase
MLDVKLQAVSERVLEHVVSGLPVEIPGYKVADGALPPPHVAKRALDNVARGCSPMWAVPFNIVSVLDALVVGGCGFKGAPVEGVVEIGYGIAPTCMRRGFAKRGVGLMLEMARASNIREVIAHISAENEPSAALARSIGFIAEGPVVDSDGEEVVRWRWKSDA